MTFTTPTRIAIRDKMLRDLLSQRPTADVSADSDWFIRATAHAGAAEGLYAHQAWIARQMLPDVCDDDVLQRFAESRGIYRKAASSASGPVPLTGCTAGVIIPAASELRRADGVAYTTAAAATVASDGTATVQVQAVDVGAAGNAGAGTGLTFSAPPSGVPAAATAGALTGGADIEEWDSVRERLQWRMRNPPAGGRKADYIAWAMSVPGVAKAWVYPLRRGDGTVDVAVMAAAGFPSLTLLGAVQAYIDEMRPVMRVDGCRVVAPQMLPVDVAGWWTLESGTDATVAASQAAVAAADYLASLAPGSTVVRNALVSIIGGIPGVVDFDLATPSSNVVTTVSDVVVQVPVLGAFGMQVGAP